MHRCDAQVLGALVSIMIVWLMTGILVYEAICRLITPVCVTDHAATEDVIP